MKRLFTGILLLVCVASAARSGRSHGYVDLGLSVRWATCNLGASSPEKAGDYYAWGETGVKDSCTVWNYRWCEGFYWNERFTKYGSVAWIYASITVILFELLITFIAPVFIMPLFNKYVPLEDGELKTELEKYAASAPGNGPIITRAAAYAAISLPARCPAMRAAASSFLPPETNWERR